MSVNVTKHIHEPLTNAQLENRADKNNDIGKTKQQSNKTQQFDWARKEEVTKQRNLRLKQVRQQSKEIASKIRDGIRNEKQRQLHIVNEIKNNELYNWQKREFEKAKVDFTNCLVSVGNAHLAAERENERIRQIEQQHEKNRKLALKRGNVAIQKEQMNRSKGNKINRNAKDAVKEARLVTVSTQVDDTLDTSDSSITSSSSASSVISVELTPSKNAKFRRDGSLDRRNTSETAKVRFRSLSPQKQRVLIQSPTKTKKPPVRSTVVTKSAKSIPSPSKQYQPEDYMSSLSLSTDQSTVYASDESVVKITRISDILSKRQIETKENVSKQKPRTLTVTSSASPKRSILKNSNNTSVLKNKRLHNEQPLKRTPLKRPPFRMQKTPNRTAKAPTSTGPAQKKQYVPLFLDRNGKRTASQLNNAEEPPVQHRVQFYDHANRFTKNYDASLVVEEDSTPRTTVGALNAMEEAKRERELDEVRLRKLAAARKKEEIRTNDALGKEKIRKDYESMSIKLDELLSNEKYTKAMLTSNELFSQAKLKEIADEKQKLMNMDFKRILSEPVPITCPKISSTKPDLRKNKSDSSSSDMNVASIDLSTGSCSSLLLDYVTNRSNDLTRDINRCRTVSNDDTEKTEKIKALNQLLEKVNGLRKILLSEIQKNEQTGRNGMAATESTSHLKEILKEMDQLEKRQKEIMCGKGNYSTVLNELNEREKLLQEKENLLEVKVKELYLREKAKKSKILTINATDDKHDAEKTAANSLSSEETPVRIVINMNKNKTKTAVNGKKWCELIENIPQEKAAVELTKVSTKPGSVYPKTPVPSRKPAEKVKNNISSTSTTLTAYLSPPEVIETDLTKTLRTALKQPAEKPKEHQNKSNAINLDPRLARYITRLLGMSRSSIEQLGISSVSSVTTPSSSLINISENRKLSICSMSTTTVSSASPIPINIDDCKMERLQQFVSENRKFINELNESFKAAPNDQKINPMKDIWKEVLDKRNKKSQEKLAESSEDQQKIKSILRKKPSAAVSQTEKKTPTKSKDDPTKNDLILKYDELTANCTKRIIDLDSMISKVREEKHKLLENTLSSAGSIINGQREPTSEYLDLPSSMLRPAQTIQRQANVQSNKSGGDSSQSSDIKTISTQSPEYTSSSPSANKPTHSLVQTKQMGISKDSGVGLSRPVTSSDYRESPDMRIQNPSDDQTKQNHSKDFQPIFGDIPRAPFRVIDIVPPEEQSSDKTKSSKPPPTALTRYSPQLEEEAPHELSTITEVDTPATSRLNATLSNEPKANQAKSLQDTDPLLSLYKRFPGFQEYRRANNMESPSCSSSTNNLTTIDSLSLIENLQKMLEMNTDANNELDYKTFRALSQSLNRTTADSSRIDFTYAKFPSHSDYAKSISGLLDSRTLDGMQASVVSDSLGAHKDDAEEDDNASLPDILNELKNRNLLRQPFEMNSEEEGTDENLLKVKRKLPHKTGQLKISSGKKYTETKEIDRSQHLKSSNESLILELEQMGIPWASTMIKKSKETNTGSTSSTSSGSLEESSQTQKALSPSKHKKLSPAKNKSKNEVSDSDHLSSKSQVDMDSHAKPINLKQFLARELLKHSSLSSSSSSMTSSRSDDSSLASIFLKSFLASSVTTGSIPSTPMTVARIQAHDKQRTSTPVTQPSITDSNIQTSSLPYPPQRPVQEVLSDPVHASDADNLKLFSGESHLSSVRNYGASSTDNSSYDKSTDTRIKLLSNDRNNEERKKHEKFEALIVPTNLQLSLACPSSTTTSTSSDSN